MRALSIAAALSGATALLALAYGHHRGGAGHYDPIDVAGFTQLISAAAGLAIANRTGPLNLIAAALFLGGAALFAFPIYLSTLAAPLPIGFLIPIGGIAMIVGWIVLAFAKPGASS